VDDGRMKKAILVAITLILSVGGCQQSEGYQSYESCVYNETTYDVNRGMNRFEARAGAIEYCRSWGTGTTDDYGESW
jgi:hypothetical protein